MADSLELAEDLRDLRGQVEHFGRLVARLDHAMTRREKREFDRSLRSMKRTIANAYNALEFHQTEFDLR